MPACCVDSTHGRLLVRQHLLWGALASAGVQAWGRLLAAIKLPHGIGVLSMKVGGIAGDN